MARNDPLTLDQLADLARKSLDNAVDLLDEADGLIAFGRFSRGYAVAILAGEEFGKFMMCQGAVGNLPGDEAFWRSFWKRFISHDEKAVNFTAMLGHVVEDDEYRRWFMENLAKHVEADQERKFAGLYVGVSPDGDVISPREAINPDWAKGVAYVLGTFIRSHADRWEGVDFHSLYRQARDAPLRWSKLFERVIRRLSLPHGMPPSGVNLARERNSLPEVRREREILEHAVRTIAEQAAKG